ncbi:MAG: pyridoxamine 5'-phosphate oxidase family protein [Chloroflexota bacterium]
MNQQGDLALLNEPVAEQLLNSTNLAHLSYVWTDGTPRGVPIWFQWDGEQVVLGSPLGAPKLTAIIQNSQVSISIDDDGWPFKVLLIRGRATVSMVDGLVPEYVQAAERYFGAEQGKAWSEQMATMSPRMGRIAI